MSTQNQNTQTNKNSILIMFELKWILSQPLLFKLETLEIYAVVLNIKSNNK